MYYSKDNAVSFVINGTTYNTWNDWRLIPTARPSIALPDVRTKYIDIPGMNGKLDISEILTGKPLYENRKGSFDFYYSRFENSNGIVLSWTEELKMVVDSIHGKSGVMYIDQDPDNRYAGRFSVKKWTTDKAYSKITIDYECHPDSVAKETNDNTGVIGDPASETNPNTTTDTTTNTNTGTEQGEIGDAASSDDEGEIGDAASSDNEGEIGDAASATNP